METPKEILYDFLSLNSYPENYNFKNLTDIYIGPYCIAREWKDSIKIYSLFSSLELVIPGDYYSMFIKLDQKYGGIYGEWKSEELEESDVVSDWIYNFWGFTRYLETRTGYNVRVPKEDLWTPRLLRSSREIREWLLDKFEITMEPWQYRTISDDLKL